MALRFFWGLEANSNTLGSNDYTVGSDSVASDGAGAPTFSGTAAKVGSYGLLSSAGNGNKYFSTSSGTVPANRLVGSVGFWARWPSAFPTNGLAVGFRFISATAARRIEMQWLTGNQVKLRIGSTSGGNADLDTSSLSLSTNAWYFFVFRWDQPNSKRAIEVYDSSLSLVGSVSDTSTGFTAPEDLVGANGLVFGNSSSSTATMHFDHLLISDVYDAPLQNNAFITAYGDYSESLLSVPVLRNYQSSVWG